MCALRTRWETGIVAEGSWNPCQMSQRSCCCHRELTGSSNYHANFWERLMCKHESKLSWSWYKSIFSLVEEILKRRRIFSLQFLLWGQIAFSFSTLIKATVKKKPYGISMLCISCNSRCLGCKNPTFPLLCDLTGWLLLLQDTTHFFSRVTKRGN